MKDFIKKRGSTVFLRIVILVIGIIALIICGVILFSDQPILLLGLTTAVIPFFLALYETIKLLDYIDKGTAFSDLSVKALRHIKDCGIVIGITFMALLPLLYPTTQEEDAPGLLLFGFAFACAPFVISVFAAVLEKLLQDAINIKSENDLTV
jgi:hypothetical protein